MEELDQDQIELISILGIYPPDSRELNGNSYLRKRNA
jgi:hypothetical protein